LIARPRNREEKEASVAGRNGTFLTNPLIDSGRPFAQDIP